MCEPVNEKLARGFVIGGSGLELLYRRTTAKLGHPEAPNNSHAPGDGALALHRDED